MTVQPADTDPFDLDFDADDEFAPVGAEALDQLPPITPRPAPPPVTEEGPPPIANPVGDLIARTEAALGDGILPRITLHVFCVRPDTAEAMQKAVVDRRLNRASSTVRPGGLPAAAAYYQQQPTPSLVMVESTDPMPELLAQLDRLAEVCDAGTRVMVIGQQNDIALYRELMRRGVSEYLTAPLEPLQVIEAVTGLYADPAHPFTGRQIAFVGAKGGVGASTIAHNAAYALSERMASNTVIVDFDLAFGTAGLDFNQDPLQGVMDALGQPDRLDPVLLERMMARCTDRLSLFAAPATLESDYDIAADTFEEVASKIRATAPFVVLDLPHAWSAWKRRLLVSADDLVIVATPDLASLRNAKNMADLVRQARPNDDPPRLVLNQSGVPGRPEISAKDFGEALGIEPSVILPFDPKTFGAAANNGQMVMEVAPKSKAAEQFELLGRLIARREPPPPQKTSWLASLLGKK